MPWILTAKLTLVHLYIWPCNHCLVIMDEGRAKEHEPSLNYWALDSQNIHSGQVI